LQRRLALNVCLDGILGFFEAETLRFPDDPDSFDLSAMMQFGDRLRGNVWCGQDDLLRAKRRNPVAGRQGSWLTVRRSNLEGGEKRITSPPAPNLSVSQRGKTSAV